MRPTVCGVRPFRVRDLPILHLSPPHPSPPPLPHLTLPTPPSRTSRPPLRILGHPRWWRRSRTSHVAAAHRRLRYATGRVATPHSSESRSFPSVSFEVLPGLVGFRVLTGRRTPRIPGQLRCPRRPGGVVGAVEEDRRGSSARAERTAQAPEPRGWRPRLREPPWETSPPGGPKRQPPQTIGAARAEEGRDGPDRAGRSAHRPRPRPDPVPAARARGWSAPARSGLDSPRT